MTEPRRAQLSWTLASVPAAVLAALFVDRVLWSWSLDCFLSTPAGRAFPASYLSPDWRDLPKTALDLFVPGCLTILVWPSLARRVRRTERTPLSVFVFAMALLFGSEMLVTAIDTGNTHPGFIRLHPNFECLRSTLSEWLTLAIFFVSPRLLFVSLRPGVFLEHPQNRPPSSPTRS